jgi:hypothetical protein
MSFRLSDYVDCLDGNEDLMPPLLQYHLADHGPSPRYTMAYHSCGIESESSIALS